MYEVNKKDYYVLIRKQHKIRLRELAEHLGCTMAHISRWENDKGNMNPEKIQKYYKYINTKIKGM